MARQCLLGYNISCVFFLCCQGNPESNKNNIYYRPLSLVYFNALSRLTVGNNFFFLSKEPLYTKNLHLQSTA